jgi:antitoxin VapB
VSLNIKNGEADRLAHELARRTGETLTAAVTAAVRERLERLDSEADEQDSEVRASHLLQVAGRVRAAMNPGALDREHGDLLYGPDGLPP